MYHFPLRFFLLENGVVFNVRWFLVLASRDQPASDSHHAYHACCVQAGALPYGSLEDAECVWQAPCDRGSGLAVNLSISRLVVSSTDPPTLHVFEVGAGLPIVLHW
jgi:hypothetical protein